MAGWPRLPRPDKRLDQLQQAARCAAVAGHELLTYRTAVGTLQRVGYERLQLRHQIPDVAHDVHRTRLDECERDIGGVVEMRPGQRGHG